LKLNVGSGGSRRSIELPAESSNLFILFCLAPNKR
jgi:hypothetical protein